VIDGTEWVTDVDNRVVELELADQHNSSNDEEIIIREEPEEAAILAERHENIEHNREEARTHQHKQAQQMLQRSGLDSFELCYHITFKILN
jgi:vacuolar-type H+-ATPase subunit H